MADHPDQLHRLLDRLREGDAHALGELFAMHQDPLRRMIQFRLDHRLNGRVSPSDVLQDAYIDAMKRVEHFLGRPDLPFFVWLRLIVAQRLVDVHRQQLGAQIRDAGNEVSMDRCGPSAAPSVCLARHLAAGQPSPSQAAMREEVVARLEEVLDGLDPIDREVLALRHFEELSNQQVAEVLGLDKAAASKRYVRALVRLKEALGQLPGFTTVD
jgi:RNA polymerase sigma-70 factor (ECF subfamily)